VAGVRELFDRFRPAGSPGGAMLAATPVDRRAVAEAELAPVFAALGRTEDEAAQLRAASSAEAAAQRAAASHRAEDLLDRARRRAPGERSAASARRRAVADAHAAALLDSGARLAEQIRTRAAERLPSLVDSVREYARAALEAAVAVPPADDDGSGRP